MISILILTLIVTSCTAFIIETLPEYRRPPGEKPIQAFQIIETGSIVVFTFEYLLRLIASPFVSSLYFLDPSSKTDLVLLDGTEEELQEKKKSSVSDEVRGKTVSPSLSVKSLEPEEPPRKTTTNLPFRSRFISKKLKPYQKIWRFVSRPLNFIDLLAILPFYGELMFDQGGGGFTVFRVFRLARVFRIFKLSKYSAVLRTFGRVMKKSMDALILMSFFIVLGAVIFGTILFYAESGEKDPTTGKYMRTPPTGVREVSPFSSIMECFYFVFVTTTTVGYGDIFPITTAGMVVTTITMHLGVLVLALPVTIIGANFAIEVEEQRSVAEQKAQDEEERLRKLEEVCDSTDTKFLFSLTVSGLPILLPFVP